MKGWAKKMIWFCIVSVFDFITTIIQETYYNGFGEAIGFYSLCLLFIYLVPMLCLGDDEK